MSHSAHRYGTVENLQNDYVFYCRTSRNVNFKGAASKLRKTFEIILSEKPANYGHTRAGSFAAGLLPEEFAKTLDRAVGVQCAFSSKEKIKNVLKKAKELNHGISIVVSGLIDEVMDITKELDIKPHSAYLSLGIHGSTSLLPDEKVLEITTMCGHGMVASHLTKVTMEKVKSGKMTPEKGAHLLAKLCPCGIFNIDRCETLLSQFSETY
jgi:hypothetical protein